MSFGACALSLDSEGVFAGRRRRAEPLQRAAAAPRLSRSPTLKTQNLGVWEKERKPVGGTD